MKRILSIAIVCMILLGISGIVLADPPSAPEKPMGPTVGRVKQRILISVNNTVDPEGDNIFYKFDFGDGVESPWIGPYESGDDKIVKEHHQWKAPGDYVVTVTAKDDPDGDGDPIDGTESAPSEPLNIHIDMLEINRITGGFGISAQIKNAGEMSKDVHWTLELIGGTIPGFHINKFYEGDVEPLGPSESQTITASPIFALGNFDIKITAECAGESIEEMVQGKALFFYVII
jgi:hypothetical protein